MKHAASPAPPGERSTSIHARFTSCTPGDSCAPTRIPSSIATTRRLRLRPPRRNTNSPTTALGRVPETRLPIRPSPASIPRLATLTHPATQSRGTDQGRQRTTRTLDPRFHHGDLPARHPTNARAGGGDIRKPPRTQRSSTGFYPVEVTVERHQTRLDPGRSICRDQGRLVAGAGFEPATFGL